MSSHYLHGDIERFRFSYNLQNAKMDWLGANLVGGNHAYPLADRAERRKIYQAHVEHALGMLYFLQNDAAAPESLRRHANAWGLARDEYPDNDNLPHLIYVREARRLAGMYVFTELDASRHPQHSRTPIHVAGYSDASFRRRMRSQRGGAKSGFSFARALDSEKRGGGRIIRSGRMLSPWNCAARGDSGG